MKIRYEHWMFGGIGGPVNMIYVSDTGNNRVVKRFASDLSYDSKIGSLGTGNDGFNAPSGVACDGTYLYVCDSGNNRIVKRNASTLAYISEIGSIGSGNNNFDNPRGICVDGTGTYIYIADANNARIVKRLAADLSYDSEIATDSGNAPMDVAYDVVNDVLYVTTEDTATLNRLEAYDVNPLSFSFFKNATGSSSGCQGCDVDGNLGYFYFTQIAVETYHSLRKRDLSLNAVSAITTFNGSDTFASGPGVGPRDVVSDGTYLYVADQFRIVKFLESDYSYISEIGTLGSGNDQFDAPSRLTIAEVGVIPPVVMGPSSFGSIIW